MEPLLLLTPPSPSFLSSILLYAISIPPTQSKHSTFCALPSIQHPSSPPPSSRLQVVKWILLSRSHQGKKRKRKRMEPKVNSKEVGDANFLPAVSPVRPPPAPTPPPLASPPLPALRSRLGCSLLTGAPLCLPVNTIIPPVLCVVRNASCEDDFF